jgi:hypothetical protein
VPKALPKISLTPVQLAYHVADPEAAAAEYAEHSGWGPFFVMQHIPLDYARHRGTERPFRHSSAYGQAGKMMVELIAQDDDEPSALRDMFTRDQTGLHHVACFVSDLNQACEAYTRAGYALALEARTTTGVDFVMIDTRETLGHMLELYEPCEPLIKFYDFVAHKANTWDGSRPVRILQG